MYIIYHFLVDVVAQEKQHVVASSPPMGQLYSSLLPVVSETSYSKPWSLSCGKLMLNVLFALSAWRQTLQKHSRTGNLDQLASSGKTCVGE
jgi:hypothetical protein